MSRKTLTFACAGLLLAAGTGCPQPSTECTKSSDCTSGKACVDGTCVDSGGACSPACSGATPVCDETAKACKVCTADHGCTGGKRCDTSVAGGKCVLCLASQDCGLELPVCDLSTKTCVTCTDSEGCQVGETCETTVPGGECVASGCTADLDCAVTPATPVCDTSARECVSCTADAHCAAAGEVCDLSSRSCVTCTAAKGCAGATPVCDATVTGGQCVGCTASSQCATASPAKPVCDPSAKVCVPCTATEGCSGGKVCLDETACVDCLTSSDCKVPAQPVCDTAQNRCVACTADQGCTAPQTCQNGQCVGCVAAADCAGTPATPVCEAGKCVVCTASEGCTLPKTCDTTVAGGRCVGCANDADCAAPTPACDVRNSRCVACTALSGCADPTPACKTGPSPTCVQCLDDADCSAPTPRCDTATNVCAPGPSDVSAQIAAVRANGASIGLNLPIDGAYVTYLKPATGNERAGFFVQGSQAGPALFVELDPAAQDPVLAAGDRISFDVTALDTRASLLVVTSISGLARQSQGNDLSGLAQDLTSADVVSGLLDYESEYITIGGTLGRAAQAGIGFIGFELMTPALTTEPLPQLRIPTALKDGLGVEPDCEVKLKRGVMWRRNDIAQPSGFTADDLAVVLCPTPMVLDAVALSPTQVAVSFNRPIDPATLSPGAFSISNGLTVSAAVPGASAKEVLLTTSEQAFQMPYFLTVASSVKDTLGVGVHPVVNGAHFTGFAAMAVLRLNELNPNIGNNRDLAEFIVTSGGSTSGIQFQQQYASPQNLYTFPGLIVAAGDVLVLHFNDEANVTSETTSKGDCTNAACYPLAWDLAASGFVGSMTFTHRVLVVRASDGSVMDAAAFANSGNASTPVAYPVDVQAIQAAGLWTPADCGGAPCTYTSTPTVLDPTISFDWRNTGTTVAGDSVHRVPGSYTKSVADWAVSAPTWGAGN